MNATQTEILTRVRRGDRPTVESLAWAIGIAEASVRRDIQVLRKEGHNIVHNGDGDRNMGPTYSYVEAPVGEVIAAQ